MKKQNLLAGTLSLLGIFRGNSAGLKVGQKMADGTIYLGYYSRAPHEQDGDNRKRDWFTTAEDAQENGMSLTMKFDRATKYIKSLEIHGHDDWELPDNIVLSKMYMAKNKGAFDGTYDEIEFGTASWYWASTDALNCSRLGIRSGIWNKSFASGSVNVSLGDGIASVRPVRSVMRP